MYHIDVSGAHLILNLSASRTKWIKGIGFLGIRFSKEQCLDRRMIMRVWYEWIMQTEYVVI